MLTRMFDLELSPEGIKTFFHGIPPADTAMQGAICQVGLNPISKISQSDLVPVDVPGSVMARLCSPRARKITDVLIDVRGEPFKELMKKN